MAVRMALDAGYHRLPPFAVAPEVTEKRRIFYFLYCVERGMAINLGRSSSILDIDITTDRPKFPDEVDGKSPYHRKGVPILAVLLLLCRQQWYKLTEIRRSLEPTV